MTQKVYLHVGAPKSGARYLQQSLAGTRTRLAAGGVLVVGAPVGGRVPEW